MNTGLKYLWCLFFSGQSVGDGVLLCICVSSDRIGISCIADVLD